MSTFLLSVADDNGDLEALNVASIRSILVTSADPDVTDGSAGWLVLLATDVFENAAIAVRETTDRTDAEQYLEFLIVAISRAVHAGTPIIRLSSLNEQFDAARS